MLGYLLRSVIRQTDVNAFDDVLVFVASLLEGDKGKPCVSIRFSASEAEAFKATCEVSTFLRPAKMRSEPQIF
jgi:hypothetical protein